MICPISRFVVPSTRSERTNKSSDTVGSPASIFATRRKQPPPLHPKLRRLPPAHPHQRSCALGIVVRPFGHRERCIGIRRKVRSRENLAQSRVFSAVALHPPLEM